VLVQPLLTSSHQGWGTGSLDRDADELLLLARCLRAEHASEGIVILGHSTGCQDAARYAARHRGDAAAAPLRGVVLQAPVSDQEWLAARPETASRLAAARVLVAAGRGEEVAFVAGDLDGAPVSARRWFALAAARGDDDMFSGDLTEEELRAAGRLGGLAAGGVPTLALLSGADEYAAPASAAALRASMTAALGPALRVRVVEGAGHSLAGKEEAAAAAIVDFLGELEYC
jgi:pimeloyl-ACP methyl ester carboxylesterase